MREAAWHKLLLSVAVAVLALYGTCSCGGSKKESCTLKIKWKEASAVPSGYLLYSFVDSAQLTVVDTVRMSKEKGNYKVRLPIYTVADVPIDIHDPEDNFSIRLYARRGRKIEVSINLRYPVLYTVSGYEEAELRSRFIRKETKLYQELINAEESGDLASQNDLWQKLRQDAARYIVRAGTKKGVEQLALEFFPGMSGANQFLSYSGLDTIPRNLLQLNNEYTLYRSLVHPHSLSAIPNALFDSIHALDRVIGKESKFLLEIAKTVPCKNIERDYYKYLLADTSLSIVSFLPDSTPIRFTTKDTLRYADRRRLLHSSKSEWIRLIALNAIDTLPCYLVMNRDLQPYCRTHSLDSAKKVLDSLRQKSDGNTVSPQ